MPGKCRDVTGLGPGDLSPVSERLDCETGAGWRGPDGCNTSRHYNSVIEDRAQGEHLVRLPDIFFAQ